MPVASEVEYWDGIAQKTVGPQGIVDNSWKRPHQIRRLLEYSWLGENVLEIGTGNGIVAGALRLIIGGHWKYIGTELGERFRESAQNIFFLKTVLADVREIPGNGYTRIIALDSLEHVRPEHRAEGYARIYSAAAEGGFLFIHYSYSTSHHDKKFDHPFGLEDIVSIEKAGFKLIRYERFDVAGRAEMLDYAFVVFRK